MNIVSVNYLEIIQKLLFLTCNETIVGETMPM